MVALEGRKSRLCWLWGPIKLRKSMPKLIAKRLAGGKTVAKRNKSDLCGRDACCSLSFSASRGCKPPQRPTLDVVPASALKRSVVIAPNRRLKQS